MLISYICTSAKISDPISHRLLHLDYSVSKTKILIHNSHKIGADNSIHDWTLEENNIEIVSEQEHLAIV